MRCKVVPHISRIGKDTATVSTSPKPIISPLRNPIVKISTRTTISTDSRRFHIKDEIASSTLSGWKNIFSVCIPAGTFFMASASRASTDLPTSGTMADDSRAMQMARAGLPSTKKPLRCGSEKPRSTRAISPSRTVFPPEVCTNRLRISSSSFTASSTYKAMRSVPWLYFPAFTVEPTDWSTAMI